MGKVGWVEYNDLESIMGKRQLTKISNKVWGNLQLTAIT
ncbi:hypothetical protein FORC065_3448 [Yersinia enterocolitica]|nr:hypothetical protein FORC065_3448 [Yersinia enterocolitica]